ncbi:hypothetical protein LXL04_036237 [Taraxacum kok-saghyz]
MTSSGPSVLAQASSTTGVVQFHLPQITIKLDRENFSLWRSTILSAVEAFDLESFILHPNPPAETYLSSDSEEDNEPEFPESPRHNHCRRVLHSKQPPQQFFGRRSFTSSILCRAPAIDLEFK